MNWVEMEEESVVRYIPSSTYFPRRIEGESNKLDCVMTFFFPSGHL